MSLEIKVVDSSVKQRAVVCKCLYCSKYPYVHHGYHYNFDDTVDDKNMQSIVGALECFANRISFYTHRELFDLHLRFARYFARHYIKVQDPVERKALIEKIIFAFEDGLKATLQLNIFMDEIASEASDICYARVAISVNRMQDIQSNIKRFVYEQHAHIDAAYCNVCPGAGYLLNIDLIRFLIDVGANINTKNHMLTTILDVVCDFSPSIWTQAKIQQSDFIAQLITFGAKVTPANHIWTIDYIKKSSSIVAIQQALKNQRERRRFLTAMRLYRSTGGNAGLKSNIRKQSIRHVMLHCVYHSFDRSLAEAFSSKKRIKDVKLN